MTHPQVTITESSGSCTSAGAGAMGEIIGRAAELAALRPYIEEVDAGARRAVALIGPPGIGKTTLLRWMHERAEEAGFITAAVRAPATAGLPPRYPSGEILEQLAASANRVLKETPSSLMRIVHTLRGLPDNQPYPAAVPQVAHALNEFESRAPLAVLIDDFHWASTEGASLLIEALRATAVPLLLAVTVRFEGNAAKADLPLPSTGADLWVSRIFLGGLSREATHTLAQSLLKGPVLPSLAEALHQQTEGNPLFAAESLRSWTLDGLVAQTAGHWKLRGQPSSTSLQDVVRARLNRLPKTTSTIVATLAVVGRDCSFEEITKASGCNDEGVVEALDLLHTLGITTFQGGRPRLAHPLFGAVAIQLVGPVIMGTVHERLYKHLSEESSARASEIAFHAVRSLRRPRNLESLLRTAAEEAIRTGSFEEAASWFELLALELEGHGDGLVDALIGQARATTQFSPDEARRLFTRALEMESSLSASAPILTGRAFSHRVAGRFDDAATDLELAARRASDATQKFEIQHARAVLLGIRGDIDGAESLLLDLLTDSHAAELKFKVQGHLGHVAFMRGDLAGAETAIRAALSRCTDEGYRSYLETNLVWTLILAGNWSDAGFFFETAKKRAERVGDLWNLQTLLCSGARLQGWQGQLTSALDTATDAVRLASSLGNPACRVAALDALATVLLTDGSATQAMELLLPEIASISLEFEPLELSHTFCLLAEAALLLGSNDDATAWLSRARSSLKTGPLWSVSIDRITMEILLGAGALDEAIELGANWLSTPSPVLLEQARVLQVLSRAHHKAGSRDTANALARRAEDSFSHLMATPFMSRTLDLTERKPRGRPRSGAPLGLTPRELEVLECLTEGHSTREISQLLYISAVTVEKHIENAMRKLGVSRRSQISTALVGAGVRLPSQPL